MVLGFGMEAGLYDPAFATMGHLYGAGARCPITTITLFGGFASIVCAFAGDLGGRGTDLAHAAIHLGVSLSLVLISVPKTDPAATRDGEHPAAMSRLIGRERLIFLVFSGLLISYGLIFTSMSVWLLAFLQARVESLATAVTLGTLIGPAQVAARVLEMAARGRHHPIWTVAMSTGAIAAGLGMLVLGFGPMAGTLILYGAGTGLLSIARGSFPLSIFGGLRYPEIMGRLARPALIAQAAAPMLSAASISSLGPGMTLGCIAALAMANLLLAALLWQAIHAPDLEQGQR